VASAARAQPAAAEKLISQGVALRKEGKDHRALPLFQQAYDLDRSARTAAQLGLCEATLGYWLAAEEHLAEALSATRHPWMARHEAEIRATLANVRAAIGQIDVSGSPAGAEVLVNGQRAGKLPLARPVRVANGAVQVTLRAPGHAEASSRAVVAGGDRVSVILNLESTNGTGAPPGTVAPLQSRVATRSGTPSGAAARGRWLRAFSWAALAASGVALGTGSYGLLRQRSHVREFDAYQDPRTMTAVCYAALPDKGGERCRTLHDRIHSDERLARVGFLAGGVLAAGALVGFYLAHRDDAPGAREQEADTLTLAGLALPPSGDGFTVRYGLRF
jgi:hypothetical protein